MCYNWLFHDNGQKMDLRIQAVNAAFAAPFAFGNFRHKHYTIKRDVAGEEIAIKHIHISNRDLTEKKSSITF